MKTNMLLPFVLMAVVSACTTPPKEAKVGPAPQVQPTIVPGSQEDLVKNVGDRIFFDFDRATIEGRGDLTRNNVATLDRQAAWLLRNANTRVEVAGNCDERGTEEYNLALGHRRAYNDAHYLLSKGVAANRITTISYGKERPTALGHDEAAWAQNRNAITSVQ